MGKRLTIFTSETMNPDAHRVCISWLNARLPCDGTFKAEGAKTFSQIEIDSDGNPKILCVAALNNWTAHTCEGHLVSDGTMRGLNRTFGFAVYQYVFEQAGRTHFKFFTSVDNVRANNMHEKLGHTRLCRVADFYGEDQDAFMYGLTRKQWRKGRFAAPAQN